MTQEKFKKELVKIQKFLELTDWDLSFVFEENTWFVWECTAIDYKRFQCHFTFDKKLLTESDEYIRKIIIHIIIHFYYIIS